MENLICSYYLGVAARKLVWADPSLGYTSMLLRREASKQATNRKGLCIYTLGTERLQSVRTAEQRRPVALSVCLLAEMKSLQDILFQDAKTVKASGAEVGRRDLSS